MKNKLYLIAFGESLKNIRVKQGLSQIELSTKAKVAQSTIVYIENGQKATNVDTILRLCDGLSISIVELVNAVEISISNKSKDTKNNTDMYGQHK